MITYKQVDEIYLEQYESIPMLVHVESIFVLEKIDNGLSGIHFNEEFVPKYSKNYNEYDPPTSFTKEFDTKNWAFFMAYDADMPIGGATVVSRTPEIRMLDNRDDLAMLWDIRIDHRYRRRGIASRLFDMAVTWSKEQGLSQLKIETQNINVPACKFYAKKGAVLCAMNEYAYYHDIEDRDQVLLFWYLAL